MYIAFSRHLVQVKTKTGFQLWLEYLFGWIDKFLKTLWGESWKENIAIEMHRCKPHIFISSWKGAKSVRILAYGLSFCARNSGVGLEMLTQRVHGQKDALLWDFFSGATRVTSWSYGRTQHSTTEENLQLTNFLSGLTSGLGICWNLLQAIPLFLVHKGE